jgi:hypothetical protein
MQLLMFCKARLFSRELNRLKDAYDDSVGTRYMGLLGSVFGERLLCLRQQWMSIIMNRDGLQWQSTNRAEATLREFVTASPIFA